MEEYIVGCDVVESVDDLLFLIRFGITAAYEHDRYGSTRVDRQGALVKIAFGYAFQQVYQVALDTEHHYFRFRVAHAAVVFDHLRVVLVDQAEEDETFIVDAFRFQPFDGRADDLFFHLRHISVVGKRNGRNGTHTAGIQAGVAFADAFIIFGYGEHFVVCTVGHDEYGAFDTCQELFDNDCLAGIAEHTVQHVAQFLFRFFKRFEDKHAFTGCQSVGFQHVRSLQRFEESITFGDVFGGDTLVTGGRDVVAHHERLGEILAAFQLCTGFGGADHRDAGQ